MRRRWWSCSTWTARLHRRRRWTWATGWGRRWSRWSAAWSWWWCWSGG